MKKQMKWILGITLTLGLTALGLRVAAGMYVASDSFRESLQQLLLLPLSRLGLKGSIAAGGVRISELDTLEVKGLALSGYPGQEVRMGTLRLRVPVGSWIAGTLDAAGALTVSDGSRITFALKAPRAILGGGAAGTAVQGGIVVAGELKDFDLVPFLSLLPWALPAADPGLALTRVQGTGRYFYSANLGSDAALNQMVVRYNGGLDKLRWEGKAIGDKSLNPPRMQVDVELKDGQLTLQSPLRFAEKIGSVMLRGGASLKDEVPQLDLDVEVEGGALLQVLSSRYFRCPGPPRSRKYKVQGPAGSPECG